MSTCFKVRCDRGRGNCDNLGLWSGVLPIFRLYRGAAPQICLILHRFSLWVLLVCR